MLTVLAEPWIGGEIRDKRQTWYRKEHRSIQEMFHGMRTDFFVTLYLSVNEEKLKRAYRLYRDTQC